MGYAATPTLSGFDFQTNAAIYLMLENIKAMRSIRLEGKEDIEIVLIDGEKILAQAKEVEEPNKNFSHVTTKLKEALTSLSDTQTKSKKIEQLIYVTNTPKPFGKRDNSNLFSGGLPARRSYNELPPKLQLQVTKILTSNKLTVNTDKLVFQTIPFDPQVDEKERFKYILEEIREFTSHILKADISKKDLHTIWCRDLFKSGTEKRPTINLTKNDIIWPIIVMIIRNEDYREFDIDVIDEKEICRDYNRTINNYTERFEFVTKVLNSYSLYKCAGRNSERFKSFLDEKLSDFYEYFAEDCIRPELRDSLLRIIIRNILVTRWQIDDLKKAAQL